MNPKHLWNRVASLMNASSPSKELSFADFRDSVGDSGLVTQEELAKLSTLAKGDSAVLANLLADHGLTKFQIAAMSDGRGSSLRVGNYDILDQLGSGGMGTVFKARHRRMKRIVALKVLAAKLSEDPIFVKRFQREVETIASLGHPNIVMAYDADEAEFGHFLVMEFVSGRDLAGCVQREGVFSLARSLNCILQAARGLAYAHAQDIIHRDIKPQNLLLDDTGVLKITDLGLARLNPEAGDRAAGSDITMTGSAMGTPDFMPPEQAVDATKIDHRADIYSLGCTLHYLLTGKSPFTGPTLMAILLAHRGEPIPSLQEIQPQASERLEQLFRSMLAKKAEERVPRMVDVVSELEAIIAALPSDDAQATDSVDTHSGSPAATLTAQLWGETYIESSDNQPATAQTSVLVVEPTRVQGSIIRNQLQEQSLNVVGVTTNGANAIDEVRRLRPRVVVSSLHLPDMSGLELARRIRSEVPVNAPGFILVTSEAAEAEAASTGDLNRVQVLSKPFTPEQLSAALKQVTGASATFVQGSPAKAIAKVSRGGARVMIVDDSGTARIKVRTVLQELGFAQFFEVADGAQAVAMAARDTHDLIVTDYHMPLMDGRALVSYLKQNPATASVPIIMFTTETDPEKLDAVRRLGVLDVVEKAFPATTVGPLLDPLF